MKALTSLLSTRTTCEWIWREFSHGIVALSHKVNIHDIRRQTAESFQTFKHRTVSLIVDSTVYYKETENYEQHRNTKEY